jgi:hypothetical protein
MRNIEFSSDGSFSAENYPLSFLVGYDNDGDVDITGTWVIHRSNILDQVIDLHIDASEQLPNGEFEQLRLSFGGYGLFAGVDVLLYFVRQE